ncbi:hypothetical protein B0H19DRAFT_1239816 [Mycena capillaripes]|nr:hypothetical protein B0H19DRAFT_1239816 [Mycena capillaripes]
MDRPLEEIFQADDPSGVQEFHKIRFRGQGAGWVDSVLVLALLDVVVLVEPLPDPSGASSYNVWDLQFVHARAMSVDRGRNSGRLGVERLVSETAGEKARLRCETHRESVILQYWIAWKGIMKAKAGRKREERTVEQPPKRMKGATGRMEALEDGNPPAVPPAGEARKRKRRRQRTRPKSSVEMHMGRAGTGSVPTWREECRAKVASVAGRAASGAQMGHATRKMGRRCAQGGVLGAVDAVRRIRGKIWLTKKEKIHSPWKERTGEALGLLSALHGHSIFTAGDIDLTGFAKSFPQNPMILDFQCCRFKPKFGLLGTSEGLGDLDPG